MNQISALNNPLGVDIPLNKPNQTKPNHIEMLWNIYKWIKFQH